MARLEEVTRRNLPGSRCSDSTISVRDDLDNVTIRDTHPSEWLTIPQILAISSNICAAKIGLGMGESKLYESFRRFGFGLDFRRDRFRLPHRSYAPHDVNRTPKLHIALAFYLSLSSL